MNQKKYKTAQLINGQKYLKDKGLIAFITLMNMFIPLSMDLYLPALPKMSSYFGTNTSITNLTLSAFFFFYAVGILIWGPISDKYGRKPVLIIGSIIYMISSIFCALSSSIYFLILARITQGIGAGGITSISIAIIKDYFSGKKRETILAIVQSMSGIAPMIAPIMGAFILKVFNWRGTFWILAAVSAVNLLLALLYKETLKNDERYTGTLSGAIRRLFVVGKNKGFIIPTLIFSLSSLPFMGYIAISSYIYVDYFRLTEQAYSYFFAANALVSIMGPVIYVKYLSTLKKNTFAMVCFLLSVLSGILVMIIGRLSPVFFVLSFMITSLMGTAIRPFSTNVLLDQQKGDTGSASSLINTLFTVFGSMGMSIASIPCGNIVIELGCLITIFSCAALIGWYVFMRSNIPCIGVK
ncbi:multidrug effflux MFS transporter [Clostridium sp. Mt-5]|uniref:Bcr/CflA family efflux transporter n=1 Tax=Clostridium moutaii TaxID=3240932 RepID=A0ABV4BSV0_9CLOT